MNSLEVSIIIPNYNGKSLLVKNLPTVVKALQNKANNIKEIIIVDDASTDESVKYIKSNFPFIKLFKHTQNRGFSASVNMGARMAKGELLCLLNTDVSLTKNFLKEVIDIFKDKTVFGVSLTEQSRGAPQGKFENGYVVWESGKKYDELTSTFWISGGSGVFSRTIWMKLKGMDEELFTPFYWEDIDISYRALKRGYKLYWHPKAKVVHNHESTIGALDQKRTSMIKERNQLLFIWKNITSKRLIRLHIQGLISRTLKHPGYIKIIFMALKKRTAVMKKRKIESQKEVVSDEAIFNRF